MITAQGYSVAEAAQNLGITPDLLGHWKRESEHSEEDGLTGGGSVLLQAELKHPHKENK